MVKIKTQNALTNNIKYICFFFLILFFIITVRAYFLQVLKSAELTKRIQRQHRTTIELTPRRGTLYDRNGKEMAVSVESDSLFARPRLIQDKQAAAGKLGQALAFPSQKVMKLLASEKPFVWVKRQLSADEAESVRCLDIDGLGFVKESRRFYPNNGLAGHVIGFTGVDSQGLEGLELEYDEVLKGKSRKLIVDRDALGRLLFIEGLDSPDCIDGHDISLTIDKNIQYAAEKALSEAVDRSQAKGGIAIVMDPWSGEVLALAIAPVFNPNTFKHSSPDVWRNRAVTDVFEPGSTFKPFLVASAIEESVVNQHDIFFCENGSYRVTSSTIHDIHPHGWLSVRNIIKYSSNIGASKICAQLGKNTFYQYIRKFGFGEESGIGFPTEVPGFVPLPYRLSEHTQNTIAFGQGLAVTAMQLATAYCALANGGLLVEPCFVKTIIDSQGVVVQEHRPVVRRRVISGATASAVKNMLVSVVDEDGTGTKAAVSGYTVAGKTGTSQKLLENRQGYCDKKVLASFAGFAPADNPCISVVVVIDEPERFTFGGQIAAPVFSSITRFIMHYLQVPPAAVSGDGDQQWRETRHKSKKERTVG